MTDQRWHDFFVTDYRSRWRAVFVAIGVGTLAGTVSIVSGDSSAIYSTMTVLATLVSLTAQVWWYGRKSQPQAPEVSHSVALSWRVGIAVAFGLGVLILAVLPASRLEAEILNRRLLLLTSDRTLQGGRSEEAKNALELLATNSKIHVSSTTLVRVRDAIRNTVLVDPTSPALRQAAKSLADYERAINTESLQNIRHGTPRTAAEVSFREGLDIVLVYFAEFPNPLDQLQISKAILAFTTALKMAGNDTALQIECHIIRGTMYELLGKHDEALDDVEAAKDLGSLDLGRIIPIEAQALVGRGRSEDLQHAVDLLTFALQSDFSGVGDDAGGDWRQKQSSRFILLGSRTLAYYKLGEYNKAVEDCRLVLSLAPPRALPVPNFYHVMILAYLQLGEMNEALQAVSEFEQRTGDPRVDLIRKVLDQNRSDPRKAFVALEHEWPHGSDLDLLPKI